MTEIDSMMNEFVGIALLLAALYGVAGMLSIFVWPTIAGYDALPEPERSIRKQKRFASSLFTLAISLGGLVMLLIKFADAIDILIGSIVVRGLIEVGLRNLKPKSIPCIPFNALDKNTGEVLGEVVGETRKWPTGAIESFRLRTSSGEVIERLSDTVVIQSKR